MQQLSRPVSLGQIPQSARPPRVHQSALSPCAVHSFVAPQPSSTRAGRKFPRTYVVSQAAQQQELETSDQQCNVKGVPQSTEWELDFCSRPILDARGKKRWELLICDASRNFEYTEFFPNNKINSVTLKAALSKILALPGARRPDKVRFFRGQMQTIISRALSDLNIRAIPSRRTFTIINWLDQRMKDVYPAMEGYDAGSPTLFSMETGILEDLPDALRGESWAFVQLPLSAVLQELRAVKRGKTFGSTFPLETAGCQDMLEEDPLIPGVAVFSRRALPLAGWTNGLELARLRADNDKGCLVLETGVAQRWRYSSYPRTPQSREEAAAWTQAVQASQGLHFLAIQDDPEGEEVAGLWLMRDWEMPRV